MGNDFFQFRQFRIQQDRCAMKVTTDACILGAWTPVPNGALHALDVGAGTGLLSLMLAQRAPGLQLDAIELDPEAAAQATTNAGQSPFADRIRVLHGDATALPACNGYDLIICNPPFFSQSLKAPEALRSLARHNDSLTAEALLQIMEEQLLPEGVAAVLLPEQAHTARSPLYHSAGWRVAARLDFFGTTRLKAARVAALWQRGPAPDAMPETLIIYNNQHRLTPEALQLLRPFYLLR